MFERFTDQARRVVVLAQEEARMIDHNYIGTEHILLGLIHEGESVANRALASQGVTLLSARDQVEKIVGRGKKAPSGHIPFTPQAKKVMELSLREALHLGDNHIGPEHILLGLLREGEGVAVQMLPPLCVDLNRLRQQVIRMAMTEAEEGPRVAVARPVAAAEAAAFQQPQVPHGWMTSVQSSLDKIVARLEVIERHLALGGSPAEPDAPPGASPAHEDAEPRETDRGEGGKAGQGGEGTASGQ
jgi:ATP-dependent Clp protease ATP-binding subunit ClpA